MWYIIGAAASFLIAWVSAYAVRRIASAYGIVDVPGAARKTHAAARPLLGGSAVYVAFFAVVGILYAVRPLLFATLAWPQIAALAAGGAVLMAGGYFDDRYVLPARIQIIFPVIAALMVLMGGVRLHYITNPFGGSFEVTRLKAYGVPLLADALVFVWLLGMMYTTKILDGVDGLVGGITAIGALMIFLLTQTARFFQPEVGLISIIFVGACAGFLMLNFPPASLFLGEGGSLFTGFILGNLAIISGGKIATTLLVMGLPMVDLGYTMYRRVRAGRSPFHGDAEHLHFKLLRKGFTARRLVALEYVIAAGFGASTLVLQSSQKMIVLAVLVGVSAALIHFAHRT